MHRETEQTHAAESTETEALEGSKESNGDQSSEDSSLAQHNTDLGDKASFGEDVFIPQFFGPLI